MADAMDLDMSLDDISKKRGAGKKNRGARGGVRGGGGGTGRVDSSLRKTSESRTASPYTREPSGGAPEEGKWGHSGFIQQNNIRGGGLAARMLSTRPPGGITDSDTPAKGSLASRLDGGGGGGARGGKARRGAPDASMAARALADARGAGGAATRNATSKARGVLNVKGASGATVEVRNLVAGTTAEDVQAIFADKGSISSCTEVASAIKGTVTVQVRFNNAADAEVVRRTFNGQIADGRKLEVVVLGNNILPVGALTNGTSPIDRGFDLLPDSGATGGGMRSDALLNDARAQVLTSPMIDGAAKRGRR